MNTLKHVVVIIGGNNEESNLSLHSARFIYEIAHGYTVKFILLHNEKYFSFPNKLIYCNTLKDFEVSQLKEIQLTSIECDLFIPLIHGIEGEGGQLQREIEKMSIDCFFSSHKSTENMFFKEKAMDILKNNGFNKNFETYFEKFPIINKPIIVKPNNKGSSIGVKYLENSSFIKESTKNHIIEEYVQGQEFSSVIINGKFYGAITIEHQDLFLSYKHKYFPHNTVFIEPLKNDQIEKDTEKIFKIFNAKDIIRIDGFLKEDGSVIYTDINPIPSIDFNSFTWLCCWEYSGNIFNKLIYGYLYRNKSYTNTQHSCKKIELPIIFGGDSPEKNISLMSALNVFIKLKKSSIYEPVPILLKGTDLYNIPINSLLLHNISNIENYPITKLCSIHHIPFKKVFLALHGGIGENGVLQDILDQQQIIYNGENSRLSSLFMNKVDTINAIKDFNINNIIIQKQTLEYPGGQCIMKPIDSGSSMDVYRVKSMKDVKKYSKPNVKYFFEPFIHDAMEMTATIYKGNVLIPSLCQKNTILSCEDKFLNGIGTNITPALDSITEINNIKQILQKLVKKFNITQYARIDFFYFQTQGKVMIIEINSLPALSMATVLFHQLSYEKINPVLFLESILEK